MVAINRKKVRERARTSRVRNKHKSKHGFSVKRHTLKSRKRVRYESSTIPKQATAQMCVVGSNPFFFTTNCAPDAESFQFICQSCLVVRFTAYKELRLHEDWCARMRSSEGLHCEQCSNHFRTRTTLQRHNKDFHNMRDLSKLKKIVGNPFLFSTTVALDRERHPHVCFSCRTLCFSSQKHLRKHEDWCGQVGASADAFKCEKCCRYFRTAALLHRHSAAGGRCDKIDKKAGTNALESVGSGMNRTSVEEATIHSVCPLCDVLFTSRYEQQVHFVTVHKLVLTELKQTPSRHCNVTNEVTCLDCNVKFASRLALVQHKRVCSKQESSKPKLETSHTDHFPVGSRASLQTSDAGMTDKTTPSASNYGASTAGAVCKPEGDDNSHGSSSDTTRHTGSPSVCSGSETASSGLRLNMAEVRDLVRNTGAKRLLLKPDGQLIILGNDNQKMLSTADKLSMSGNFPTVSISSNTSDSLSPMELKPISNPCMVPKARSAAQNSSCQSDQNPPVTKRSCQQHVPGSDKLGEAAGKSLYISINTGSTDNSMQSQNSAVVDKIVKLKPDVDKNNIKTETLDQHRSEGHISTVAVRQRSAKEQESTHHTNDYRLKTKNATTEVNKSVTVQSHIRGTVNGGDQGNGSNFGTKSVSLQQTSCGSNVLCNTSRKRSLQDGVTGSGIDVKFASSMYARCYIALTDIAPWIKQRLLSQQNAILSVMMSNSAVPALESRSTVSVAKPVAKIANVQKELVKTSDKPAAATNASARSTGYRTVGTRSSARTCRTTSRLGVTTKH